MSMGPIFSAFSFFAKNEEFAAIFREKRKKTKKNPTYKNRQNWICLNQFFQFLVGKISRQGFSSFFAKCLPFFELEYARYIVEL